MNTTSANMRPIALDAAVKTAIAVLLVAATYATLVLADPGGYVAGTLRLTVSAATIAVAAAGGASAANLVSAAVANKPYRPGHIVSVNTDFEEPDFDPGLVPLSKTQTVLLTLIALLFALAVVWLFLPLQFQMLTSYFMSLPLGLMFGLGYRL